MRPLLVGESNPRGADARFALWPAPEGCSGWRLCRLLGLTSEDYLARFARANLLTGGGEWDARAAREEADRRLDDPAGHGELVLLGRRVQAAFRLSSSVEPVRRLTTNFGRAAGPFGAGRAWRVVVLPHPSGLCRSWNDPAVVVAARDAVSWLEGGGA